jgi:hypothetical protein
VDETSRKLLDNAVKEDEILSERVTCTACSLIPSWNPPLTGSRH